MRIHRRRLTITAAAAAAVLAGCGNGTHSTNTTGGAPPSRVGAAGAAAPCSARNLSATFTLVPGSAGAGHVAYSLTIRNRSQQTCFVGGIPRVVLLDARKGPLPTHVRAEASQAHAPRVTLEPTQTAMALARFSPDVPGPGESTSGPCQPAAHSARVAPRPGRGSLVARVEPPTSVCEHGTLTLRPFAGGQLSH